MQLFSLKSISIMFDCYLIVQHKLYAIHAYGMFCYVYTQYYLNSNASLNRRSGRPNFATVSSHLNTNFVILAYEKSILENMTRR